MKVRTNTTPQITVSRAIEHSFPFPLVSQLAEHESWRKEVYRPLSYIHKWWARRLGSVFRAILLACLAAPDQDVEKLLWERASFPDAVVFDPFMGSGTTIYEALKLGCAAIGRDINPVAYTMVNTALQRITRDEVETTFRRIEDSVSDDIRALYTHVDTATGSTADVLYYFWVKTIPCPTCARKIDLFKSRVFVKHAYPSKHPEAKALCPKCFAINDVRFDAHETQCAKCGTEYDPQEGTVSGASQVNCPHCGVTFSLIKAVRTTDTPPQERMYAKMVLMPTGDKQILATNDADLALYQRAEAQLPSLWPYIPQVAIQPGNNTDQILNYNYRSWHQLFNSRQLVALGLLASEIAKIPQPEVRQLFACLFSGMLEFNNMFASFKGIGTGAVRHMFAHHILKPELTPLEANPWGTDRSSGSFSTLYESRILRAIEYKASPFEFRLVEKDGKTTSEKVFGISQPLDVTVGSDYASFAAGKHAYLSVGDSGQTDIAEGSVDLVITDPPFFDNVHYSELADFFYVWLRSILRPREHDTTITTRSPQEVQSTDAQAFAGRLSGVFAECHRVLKGDGLLVFTYHHSRNEGWLAVYEAIRRSGFCITKTYPVKAEMAVSVPIKQASSPVNYDLIIVCRKGTGEHRSAAQPSTVVLADCLAEAAATVIRLREASLQVSVGDVKVILLGCMLSRLAGLRDLDQELAALRASEAEVDDQAESINKSAMPQPITRKSQPATSVLVQHPLLKDE